ncbi:MULTISPECIES: hypothetical protein [Oceanobacillus]|uniref:Uncharacterized protein n=1 Tax=Oceanobacillus kimchii TaxID=746691 RepID=A0ABQ5TP71_9BACI|nr:hypothetical protein [Oceanobacillus kimchii]GLO68315.1 hypothetical protein MACH08_40990 [Oceanobacillus kimchii]
MSPFQLIIISTVVILLLTSKHSMKDTWKQKLIAIVALSAALIFTEHLLG